MAFPGSYSFNYYNGDTLEFQVYPKDSNGGVFDNLSDYTPRFVIATDRGSAGTIKLDSDNSSLVAEVSVTEDYITCQIPASGGGSQLTDATYVYDVSIEHDANGKIYTLLTGTITVTQDVG